MAEENTIKNCLCKVPQSNSLAQAVICTEILSFHRLWSIFVLCQRAVLTSQGI